VGTDKLPELDPDAQVIDELPLEPTDVPREDVP
jgi:hypothetical protein